MKQRIVIFLAVFFLSACGLLFSQNLSGVVSNTVNYMAESGGSPSNSWGIENYANVRFQIKANERTTIYSAVNLIAVSGNYLENASLLGNLNPDLNLGSTPFVYGQNYAACLELERLYFRINSDYFDTEAGLLRLPFGYGQVWGSSDFLNPQNPLFPNARPRGVLGTDLSFYPTDSTKLMVFAAAPKEPLVSDGGGFIPGFSLDQHWDKASLQFLYAYEVPGNSGKDTEDYSEWGIHRFGLSVKADLELGLVLDALYTCNSGTTEDIGGLSSGAGFDYSFLDGDLYILFEYLYNGSSSSTAWDGGNNLLGWKNNHYLYGNVLYRFNAYTSFALSTVFCFDDLSFSPFATFNYEIFQGLSLNLSVRIPLDQKTLNGGRAGELGPNPPVLSPGLDGSPGTAGARVIVNAGVKLRF